MKQNRIADRGQVLIIFVFAIVGLVGMTGLAIDGGNIFSDRRHAQNAADTSALTAALVKVRLEREGATNCTDIDTTPSACGAQIINATLDRAAENGYTNNVADSSVAIHIPPQEGPYSDCGADAFNCYDYVEVVIDSQVNTFFARVLGVPTLHNHVVAVARSQFKPSGSLYYGNALVALDPGQACSSAAEFYTSGSSTVKLIGSGIFINSDCPVAFKEESGCINMEFYDKDGNLLYPQYDPVTGQIINTGTVQGVPGGGSHTSSCPTAPTLNTTGQQQQFPPEEIFDRPAECGQTPRASTPDADGFRHFYPGRYSGQFPPGNSDARLDPGVYCVDGLMKITNPRTDIEGDNVMIYISPGGGFSLTGGDVRLTAPTTDPYKGYVIYVAPQYSTGTPALCKLVGGSASQVTGVIWAPYCRVEVGGGSEPQGFNAQIIAYSIKIVGTSDLTFTWNSDEGPTTPELNKVGLYH
jgi:hypothetical protein